MLKMKLKFFPVDFFPLRFQISACVHITIWCTAGGGFHVGHCCLEAQTTITRISEPWLDVKFKVAAISARPILPGYHMQVPDSITDEGETTHCLGCVKALKLSKALSFCKNRINIKHGKMLIGLLSSHYGFIFMSSHGQGKQKNNYKTVNKWINENKNKIHTVVISWILYCTFTKLHWNAKWNYICQQWLCNSCFIRTHNEWSL